MFISGAVGPGEHEAEKSSLWVVSILGGKPRRLRGDAFGAEVSPDGKLVAFNNDSGIWIAASNGDAPRQFLADIDDETRTRYQRAEWSWDGDRIVYMRIFRDGNRRKQSIESRDLEGGSPTTLVSGVRLKAQFLPLEDRIIYVRRGEPNWREENLWEIAVDPATLKPKGEPRQLTDWTDFNFSNLSISRDGEQLIFLKSRRQADVYVGEIEGGGTDLGGIRRLSLNDKNDWPFAWTPDSAAVVYGSDRGGPPDLFRHGLDQRTATVLVSAPGGLWHARLTPDRSSFLYWSSDPPPDNPGEEDDGSEPSFRLMRVPVSGGPTEIVLEITDHWSVRCSSVVGGGCVLTEHDDQERRNTFYRLDPVDGKGEELLSLEFDRDAQPEWSLSPDGTQLAIVGDEKDGRSLRILDLSGNVVEEIVLKGLPGANLTNVSWPASGPGFFVSADSPRGQILGFIEPTGELHVLAETQSGGFGNLVPSPDGRRLAYQLDSFESNVWTIDEF